MRHTTFRYFLFLLLALALITGSAYAQSPRPRHDFTEAPAPAQSPTGYAIVTFKDPPAASYTGGIPGLERTKPERGRLDPNSPAAQAYLRHLENAHASYRSWLARNVKGAEVVGEYSLVANGMAIQLNGARLDTLKGGPGVRTAAPSWLYQPTMNASVELIGATDLWPLAGGQADAGAGIKVGIIDSGIDDTHPFFACKSAIPHKVYASGVAGDPSNVLVNDHGTHVAGTVAGCLITLTDGPITGEISGVAPGAELWDYNVFPGYGAGRVAFVGSAFSHDIINALEDSVRDGMHVVNMSLGGTVQGPHDLLAEAVNATVDAGLVVAVAAGNAGPGDSTVGSPGSAANALTVGASTNSHTISLFVHVTPEAGAPATYLAAEGEFDPFEASPAIDVPLANWTSTGGSALACLPAPDPAPVAGTVALISRGECSFTTKIRNAQNAGAVGVVMYNNVAGPPIGMAHDGTEPFPTIPAVMVSNTDGAAILASLPAVTTIVGPGSEAPAQPDIIAGFSSRGPSPFNYLIKPDLTAPGVNIYSSVFNGGFEMFQGTSMATPHIAGSAALLLQLHPDWSPADVKSALANNAARVVTDHQTGTMDPGPLARGGGRADLPAAHATPLTIDPVSASFGYWSGRMDVSASVDLTIRSVSANSQTCSVAVVGSPLVTVSTDSITLQPGESTTVTVQFSGGRSASGDYSGDVSIDCGSAELLVPWWTRINRQGR
jgi:minor extracellular serine protease Vpr